MPGYPWVHGSRGHSPQWVVVRSSDPSQTSRPAKGRSPGPPDCLPHWSSPLPRPDPNHIEPAPPQKTLSFSKPVLQYTSFFTTTHKEPLVAQQRHHYNQDRHRLDRRDARATPWTSPRLRLGGRVRRCPLLFLATWRLSLPLLSLRPEQILSKAFSPTPGRPAFVDRRQPRGSPRAGRGRPRTRMKVVLLLSMQGIVGYRHRSHGVGVKARPNHAASASVDLISLLLRDRLPRRAPVRQHGIQSHHLSLPWSPLPLRSPRSSCRARPRIQKVGGRRAPRSSLAPSSNGRPLPLLSLPRLDRYASSLHRLSIVFCLGACLAPRELSSRPAAACQIHLPSNTRLLLGQCAAKGLLHSPIPLMRSNNSSSNSSILLLHTEYA